MKIYTNELHGQHGRHAHIYMLMGPLVKLLKDPLFPIISQSKVQVAIATKVMVRLTK